VKEIYEVLQIFHHIVVFLYIWNPLTATENI